jgi:hypothetical protein
MRPALAGAQPRIVSPYLGRDGAAALGLWTRHAVPNGRIDLPARVHAVALAPNDASCVAVARRPGRFAIAVDLARFERSLAFEASPDRHFFGHGMFVDQGRLFLTTENDYEAGRGVIGLRDVQQGFRAIGEWPSGGVGPHDLALSADGRTLLVANGGIDTSPLSGRAKLNGAAIVASVARIDLASGRQRALVRLAEDEASLSIRHLALLANGAVAFACQETLRDGIVRPLVGLIDRDDKTRWLDAPPGGWASLSGYIGAVATDKAGRLVAATAPLAGLCGLWDATSAACLGVVSIADCCGLAPLGRGFVVTSGRGDMLSIEAGLAEPILTASIGFDNHCAVL